ncbi:unnamed protein product [Trichogramma brassicae]|uniref:RNA-directed DNA polymerase n=1 Tax=Trichogramma brassicae TaxID=86971 RepID=A0A6H5IV02_9HYME|nr:unnamed protein product [Trichogramma brassicae]
MSGLRPKRCNGAGVRPLQLLVRPFGKRAGGGAGSVAVPLKSHTRPKESDRADDALIRWCTRLEQQDKLKVPTLGEVLAHCEWPRDDTLIPMPGGGTISEWCLRDLSAAGERPAGQADEGIEKIAEPCETRKQNAWSQGEFVTLELGGEAEESTQKKNRMRRGDKARVNESKSGEVVAPCERPRGDFSTPKPREDSLLDVTSKGRSRKTLRSVSTVENDRVSTLEERLSGEESSRGEKVTLKPGEDCTRGTIPRNPRLAKTLRVEGVASATASSTVCRSQTQSLVSGEYNSDEEIECLDSVYMATPETSMPDEQDGADSGPEEGVTVTTIADIHEPRESERRGPTRSIIYLDIAAMTRENRFFVDVRVGPFTYKALLDSGAQCCLAGPRMMRELAERIKPSMSLIGYANQQTQPSGGYLPVMLQIDREAGRIDMECTEILPVEMVLGVDFGRRWRVDISMGRNQWRSGDGPWHNFAKLNEARSMRCDIVAECAGITVYALSRAFECDERSEFFAFERIEDEWYMKKLSEVKKSPSKYTNWYIEDGMLYKRSYNALLDPVSNAENSWRLVVPAEQRERVLTESHCLTSSGHLGAKKTYDRLACEYWWPGMWYAVEEYCNSCDVCQRYKVPQTGPKGLMTRRVVDRPWAVVAADMMEFPRSKNQNKWSATPTRSNGVRLPPLSGEQPEGLHRQSGRRWTSERGRRAPRETPARRQEPAKRRFCEAFDARIGGRDGLGGVRSARQLQLATAGVATTNGRRQKKSFPSASTDQRRWHAPAYSIAGRGTSPERRRREPLLEEETRAMLEQLVAARQPVEEWDGEAFEEVFRGSPEEEVLLLEEGEATATLRRSGETTEESARVPTPPLAPVQEPSALPLPPPVQQVSYVAGLHGLVFQPFAVQQQRLPQTEYPLDGQQQRQLRRPGPYQEQQQHRQLPRRQPQQHQREEVRVEVRPLSPVAGPSSLSGNTAAPARIRGENFGGLEPVGFVPGLDPPRGACFECHEPGHTRRQCRKPYNGDLCTNCGRRGVKVRHCPRCSRGMEEEPKELPFEESRSEEAAMESARRRKVDPGRSWTDLQPKRTYVTDEARREIHINEIDAANVWLHAREGVNNLKKSLWKTIELIDGQNRAARVSTERERESKLVAAPTESSSLQVLADEITLIIHRVDIRLARYPIGGVRRAENALREFGDEALSLSKLEIVLAGCECIFVCAYFNNIELGGKKDLHLMSTTPLCRSSILGGAARAAAPSSEYSRGCGTVAANLDRFSQRRRCNIRRLHVHGGVHDRHCRRCLQWQESRLPSVSVYVYTMYYKNKKDTSNLHSCGCSSAARRCIYRTLKRVKRLETIKPQLAATDLFKMLKLPNQLNYDGGGAQKFIENEFSYNLITPSVLEEHQAEVEKNKNIPMEIIPSTDSLALAQHVSDAGLMFTTLIKNVRIYCKACTRTANNSLTLIAQEPGTNAFRHNTFLEPDGSVKRNSIVGSRSNGGDLACSKISKDQWPAAEILENSSQCLTFSACSQKSNPQPCD